MVKKKDEQEDEEEESGGMSLDDAFGDDDDVEYAAESKPKKLKKVKKKKEEVSFVEGDDGPIEFKMSKPVKELKRGDKLNVDGVAMEVDAHYILIEHEGSNEIAIEIFDPMKDRDYQLRYFEGRFEDSAEFFELDEIVYQRRGVKKISW